LIFLSSLISSEIVLILLAITPISERSGILNLYLLESLIVLLPPMILANIFLNTRIAIIDKMPNTPTLKGSGIPHVSWMYVIELQLNVIIFSALYSKFTRTSAA